MKTCYCLILLLLLTFVAAGQTAALSENDKSQIIETILKKHDFNDGKSKTDKSKISIKLLAENITPKQLSHVENVNVILISEKDIDAMIPTGGEYYYFNEFEAGENSTVKVTFGRIGIGKATGRGAGNYWKYECRKVSDNWKVKSEFGGIFHLLY